MSSTPAALPLEIDVKTVHEKLKAGETFLLLDCREKDEHATVNIPEATLIPMSELGARVDELQPHQNSLIVVHCHHGGRSLRVARFLRDRGYAQAQSMAGGIDQWAVQINPQLPRY